LAPDSFAVCLMLPAFAIGRPNSDYDYAL